MKKRTLIWTIVVCAAIICACGWIKAREAEEPAGLLIGHARQRLGQTAPDGEIAATAGTVSEPGREDHEASAQGPSSFPSLKPLRNIPASFLCDLYGEDMAALTDGTALWTESEETGLRQTPLLAGSVGVDWFDVRTDDGLSGVCAAALDT